MAANIIFTCSLRSFIICLLVHLLPLVILSRSLNHKNTQTINHLLSLEGLSKGQTSKNLPYIRSYLERFGYLNRKETTLNDDYYFDEVLETAVKLYQKNYNLNITGKLDYETLKEIASPRCGVADTGLRFRMINNGGHTSKAKEKGDFVTIKNSSLYAFFDGSPRWPDEKAHLTYTFNSAVEPVPQGDLTSASSQAFAEWTKNSHFTFEQAGEGSDLTIGFFEGDHGDGVPFDGPGGVLAHAFPPTDGRLHIDATETWSLSPPAAGELDLVWVALHEIGHLLGLGHSSDPDAVMFARASAGVTKRTLSPDDIAGIQALYATS